MSPNRSEVIGKHRGVFLVLDEEASLGLVGGLTRQRYDAARLPRGINRLGRGFLLLRALLEERRDVLSEGTAKARAAARETMDLVRSAMGVKSIVEPA